MTTTPTAQTHQSAASRNSVVARTTYIFEVVHLHDATFNHDDNDPSDIPDGPHDSPLGRAMSEAHDGHAIGWERCLGTRPVPLAHTPSFFDGDLLDSIACPACGDNDICFQQGAFACETCGHDFAADTDSADSGTAAASLDYFEGYPVPEGLTFDDLAFARETLGHQRGFAEVINLAYMRENRD